jgi:hypothetical protein
VRFSYRSGWRVLPVPAPPWPTWRSQDGQVQAGRAAVGRCFFQRSQLIDRKELGGAGRLYSWAFQASLWAKNGKKSGSDGGYHGVYRVP